MTWSIDRFPNTTEIVKNALTYSRKQRKKCKKCVDLFPKIEGTKYGIFILPVVPSNVEVVSLLQKMSNTRERTITLDVEMEDYHRIKNRTEVTADATE